jgi:hypothetical protein
VVGRAGRRPEGADLLLEETGEAFGREHRGRRLEQEGLVGRAAALGDEEELVGRLPFRVDLDLRRQVVLRIRLLEHGERRQLAVAQVVPGIGVEHPLPQRRLVAAAGPDQPALLAHDDGGARVLAHGQDAAGGDVRVLQQVEGHEAVVGRGPRVVEDLAKLRQVARTQQVVDVGEGLLREEPQRLGLDLEDLLALETHCRDALF